MMNQLIPIRFLVFMSLALFSPLAHSAPDYPPLPFGADGCTVKMTFHADIENTWQKDPYRFVAPAKPQNYRLLVQGSAEFVAIGNHNNGILRQGEYLFNNAHIKGKATMYTLTAKPRPDYYDIATPKG